MSANLYNRLKGLFPASPLLVGTVVSTEDGTATLELPDGKISQARGNYADGTLVYFRNGVIESVAPTLPYEEVDI